MLNFPTSLGPFSAAGGGSSTPAMVKALSANAARGITGNDVTTFADSSDELQGTVDTTGTASSALAHLDLLFFEPPADAVVSADPAALWSVDITTTPGTGADVYFVFGWIYSASVAAATPATDTSIWWMIRMGPGTTVGTNGNLDVRTNNANPGTDSNLATFVGCSTSLLNVGGKRLRAYAAGLYNNNNSVWAPQNTSLVTPTSTHLLIPFCGFGHQAVGAGDETLGVTARYFVGV